MIVVTGKQGSIMKYFNEELKGKKVWLGPDSNVHYSEYEGVISDVWRFADAIFTQNKEFLECLLKSESRFNFEVHTVYEDGSIRVLSKEDAYDAHFNMGLELR